ncbi:hypothetical protein F5Y00DRAFT_250174 [Daldinia vernicosa]|uniref:uncharacterized protein n=1 Tax=Daldinia vernicosa TaxID=114800 RepID=UPI0020079CCB|nr:uncharacterized protein F5Y00DRAFT_250174 [Daldinia vernicosa]KAI0843824.1 hypothetical protein F5Y00DRAFT_250174 [Daldinia vernicosa]
MHFQQALPTSLRDIAQHQELRNITNNEGVPMKLIIQDSPHVSITTLFMAMISLPTIHFVGKLSGLPPFLFTLLSIISVLYIMVSTYIPTYVTRRT